MARVKRAWTLLVIKWRLRSVTVNVPALRSNFARLDPHGTGVVGGGETRKQT
jgi:hypothetical protein